MWQRERERETERQRERGERDRERERRERQRERVQEKESVFVRELVKGEKNLESAVFFQIGIAVSIGFS